jgi:hypothetical protein
VGAELDADADADAEDEDVEDTLADGLGRGATLISNPTTQSERGGGTRARAPV